MRKFVLILTVLINGQLIQGFGPKPDQREFNTLVKTNLLNAIMLPSVHVEQQIGLKSSLQLNLHRGSIVFISPNEWFNTSLNYRKYWTKKSHLNGFYTGIGITFYHNYLQSWYDSIAHQDNVTGASYMGPEFRLGFQTQIKQSRWYWDTNLGYALPAISLNKLYSSEDGQARLMLGIGYRF